MSKYFGTTAVAIILIFSLSILLWGFDKGFNLSDGGCYVLRYQNIQPSTPSDYTYFEHYLVKALVPPEFRSIIGLRIIGFVLNLLSTIFFAFCISVIHKRVNGRPISPHMLALSMSTGLILSYQGLPSELSYNSLNQFFLINCASFVLLALTTEGKISRAFTFLSGVACCLIFVAKASSGLMMSLISSYIILRNDLKDTLRIVYFWIPFFISFCALVIFIRPDFIGVVKYLIENPGDHTVPALIKSVFDLSLTISSILVATFIIYAAFRRVQQNPASSLMSILCLITGTLLLTVVFALYIIDHLDGGYVTSGLFILIIGLLFFNRTLSRGFPSIRYSEKLGFIRGNKLFLLSCLLLVLVPYVGAFGSWVSLNWISKFYYVSFCGLIVLLIPSSNHKIIKGLTYLFFLYLSAIGLYNYVQHPYKWEPSHKPLYEQTVKYKGIKLSPDRVEYLQRIEKILIANDFRPEQGMIIPYVAPGIAYLMGSYHVGGILWRPGIQKEYFRLLKRTHLHYKPVIITVYYEPDMQFRELLYDSSGIKFPGDYKKVAEFLCFDDLTTTRIYVPISKEMVYK